MIPYTKTSSSISVIIGFLPTIIPSSHPNFADIVRIAQNTSSTEADLAPYLDTKPTVDTFTGGNVVVLNGRLYFKGFEVKSTLATIILGFVKAGQTEDAKPYERFLEKCYANPDPRAVEGLYDWIVAGGLPITPEGDILAWKAVKDDYYSIRSGPRGALRHMIGDVVSEPRNECNANPNETCSRGIHFCSVKYLQDGGYASGGSRIMAVTINPENVVSFPKDYGLSKGRACELTVVGEVPIDKVPTYYAGAVALGVYSGWTSKTAAAPASSFPVQVGDVWRTADGRDVTITDTDGPDHGLSYGPTAGAKGHPDRGRWFARSGLDNGHGPKGQQLTTLVSRKGAMPAPTDKGVAVKVGDVVMLFDGTRAIIKGDTYPGDIVTTNDASTGRHIGHVFTKTGRCGKQAGVYYPTDVAYVVSSAPAAPRTPRNANGFAVGQVWKNRQGSELTIKSITHGGEYPIRTNEGASFTANGRYASASSKSGFDLVKLVKDVA